MNSTDADVDSVVVRLRPNPLTRMAHTISGAVLVVVALALADALTGLNYRTSTDASVIVTRPKVGAVNEALIVFPGYASDGTVVSKAFAPYLAKGQAMIVVRYAQREIDDQAVYRLIINQLNALAPHRVRILGGSLGGIVAARFLDRYMDGPARVRFGSVTLVLDTAPSGSHNIRRPQWVFSLCSWYRGGAISSAIWALISRLGSRPLPEPGADRAIIEDGNNANAWVGMPTLTTQASYLSSFGFREVSGIHDVVSHAVYLEARSPQDDPLVRVSESIADWRFVLPNLAVSTIATRRGDWHLPWTYRPRETLDAVNAA